MIARFDGALSGEGFSTMSVICDDAVLDLLARHDPVLARLRARDFLQRDHRIAAPLVELHHLPDAGLVGVHDVVAEQHGEGLVADEVARLQDGVAEAEGLLLPHVRQRDELGDLPDLVEQRLLALLGEHLLELEGRVEVVLDGVLAAARDDDDALDAGVAGFLDDVLDERPVHERQHFLRLGLGGRQEAGAEAGRGEDGDANLGHADSVADEGHGRMRPRPRTMRR